MIRSYLNSFLQAKCYPSFCRSITSALASLIHIGRPQALPRSQTRATKVPTFLAAISMVNVVVSIALLAPWSSTASGLGSHRRQITPETSNEFIDGGCRDVILFFARGTGAPGNMVRWQLRPHTAEFAGRRRKTMKLCISNVSLFLSAGTSTRTTIIRRAQIRPGRRSGRHPRNTILGCYSRQFLPWRVVSQ